MIKHITTLCVMGFAVLILHGCTGKQTALLQPEGDEICREVSSGRMWQRQPSGPFATLEDAVTYAEQLSLGGYDDWRLPTGYELLQLCKTVSRNQSGECRMKRAADYWSREQDGSGNLGRWETEILCDVEFIYIKALKRTGFVRAVRP